MSSDKRLPEQALQALQAIFAGKGILFGTEALPWAVDESHALIPRPLAVVMPETHEQVAQTVRWANHYAVALVPSGGRTGLSGGACAGHGEVVVNLSRMNRIVNFDAVGGLLTVEAGVVLETLQDYVAGRGWFYPVDYASRGSAQMGGAVATNAGGIRVLRYGMTRDWVAGLKAVTGAGETLHINRFLAKDNAGYDLKNLLAGSEGTLAIITEVTVKLTRPMAEQQTVLIGLASLAAMIELFIRLRDAVTLNAAEFFCASALQHVVDRHGYRKPFSCDHAYYLLVEFDKAALADEELAEVVMGHDVIVSHGREQAKQLWRYRELISSTINPLNPYKNDIACSLARLAVWFADLQQGINAIHSGVQIIWFGHLGDGNLHLNILRRPDMQQAEFDVVIRQCAQVVAEVTSLYVATICAEHGIGLLKREWLSCSRSMEEVMLYQQIKRVFDPCDILNPGKLLLSVNTD